MSDKKRTVLVPSYLEKFVCIGSSCEDSCCVGWRVAIDKKTYKRYKNVDEKEMKSLLASSIHRNRSNPSERTYAKISMQSDGSCPLLDKEKMCTVQKRLGEEYLSDVCCTYPRHTNKVDEVLEKSVTLSCPEAARLALLNPEGIEFNEIEESIHVRNIISKELVTDNKTPLRNVESYFWNLRIFTIQVLQNRNYSLTDRLIILGMFFQKLSGYISEGNLDEIPGLINSYTVSIQDDNSIRNLSRISTPVAIQMQLLKELVDIRISQGVKNERYLECFEEVFSAIQYTQDSTVEEVAERYQQAYTQYYAPFMNQHEYILENYLVNYVYKNLFPISNYKNIFEDYVLLVVHYSMIKLHLIGMAGYHKDSFGIDHIIKLIQSFARVVEHNPLYLRNVIELLKSNNYTSMAYMVILINN